MNAVEYIKDYGVDRARKLSFDPLHPQMTHITQDGCNWINADHPDIQVSECELLGMIDLRELRRFIESIDTVRGFGGLGMTKLINQTEFCDYLDLTQAIRDFEMLGGGHV